MLKKSTLEQVNKEAPPVTFVTTYYEKEHGAVPTPQKKGTYLFIPPLHLGKRPVECVNMSFSQAKKTCKEWIGDRPAYGEFILMP